MSKWECPECHCQWPTANSIDAYNNRLKAFDIHPNIQCYELVKDFSITGIYISKEF